MAYSNICEKCGAHLDPCEKCDCTNEAIRTITPTSTYLNKDRKCECRKCEMKVSCVYHDRYQRLSSRDAVGALGLCPKLPESFRR